MTHRASRLRVFSTEDTAIQLTWRELPPGKIRVRVRDVVVERNHPGGPGALMVKGLEPKTRYVATVDAAGLPQEGQVVRFQTSTAPLGRELYRFATLSDLHLGIEDFGRTLTDPPHAGLAGHAPTCTRAAIDELLGWGAQRLFVKGDITNASQPSEWDLAGKVFADVPIPVHAMAGNHDVRGGARTISPFEGAHRAGLTLHSEIACFDLPGIRVVLAPTAVRGHSRGRLTQTQRLAIAESTREARLPCLVLIHHHFEWTPFTWFWPPGLSYRSGRDLLALLTEANRNTMVSSGHTHRHRRRVWGPIPTTEVGSPKDYPGTWAGYVVHEGGIRQLVRRIENHEAISWNEMCRHAAGGAWGLWAPGRKWDRSVTWNWSPRLLAPRESPVE